MDRDDWSPTTTKKTAARPPTALTSEQHIRWACLRIGEAAIAEAARSDNPNRGLSRDQTYAVIDGMVAYVTTGNWPDTNGTKE